MGIPNSTRPLFLGAAAASADTGYNVERSLRFNSADSAYLSRTPASAGNRKTWTWAGWVKRSGLGSAQILFSAADVSSEPNFDIDFGLGGGDSLRVRMTNVSAAQLFQLKTTQVFRDASAWYHIVVAVDTTQLTASNRIKIYVNGSQVVSFSTETYPTQNLDTWINDTVYGHAIGRLGEYNGLYFNGYLADIHFIDGQALTPSSFTETDATTGQLIPKAYSGTYGTNGFHLPFSDNSTAAALGTDTSGNGNDWTVNNITAGPTTTSNSWSGYFRDAVADYITTPSNAAFGMGTGDWTVEGWFYGNKALNQFNVAWHVGTINATDGMAGSVASNSVGFRSNGTTDISASISIANQWAHIAWVKSSNTVTIYVNGSSVTSGTYTNSIATGVFTIDFASTSFRYGGYISNLRVLKGTAQYTSNFTPPSSPLTAITNTSLLTLQDSTFIDNSTNAFTLSATGATVSYLSPFEESVDTDSLVDTPTSYGTDTGAGGEVRGNYCTWNPLDFVSTSLADGNLQASGSTDIAGVSGTIGVTSGKWYWEVTAGSTQDCIGVWPTSYRITGYPGYTSNSYGYYGFNGQKINSAAGTAYGSTFTTNDVIGIALDLDTGTLTFYKNNVSQGTAFTSLSGGFRPAARAGAASGASTSTYLNAGQRPFAYTAPSGFKALVDTNLPTPVVAQPSTVMDVALYTGNGGNQSITLPGGFNPDLVWIKSRSNAQDHYLFDAVRGGASILRSNTTGTETTGTTYLSFDTSGFSSLNGLSSNGYTYAAWCWDAGSSTVTNTQGSITSSVRANASAGFSIVTFTAPSSNQSFTVGHGLGIAPAFTILKRRDSLTGGDWWTWHIGLGDNTTDYLALNQTSAENSLTSMWGTTGRTSSLLGFSVQNSVVASGTYVVYCFAPVTNYSAFGSYTGNGSTDGPFVYTGFRPRWVVIKASSASGSHWMLFDTARSTYNLSDDQLYANLSNAEIAANSALDFLANGFKCRADTFNNINGSSITYIYAAFAENPFQYARAR